MTVPVTSQRKEDQAEASRGIIVLGMHRAGTSTITSVLANLGFELPGEQIPANWDNPKGYWEPREIVETHDAFLQSIDRSWSDPRPLTPRHFLGEAAETAVHRLRRFFESTVKPKTQWVIKDPRMCRLLPLWEQVLDAEALDLHRLLIIRSPLAVAASLQKRDGFSVEKSLLLWLRHYLEVEAATRDYPRNWLHFEGLSGSPPTHSIQPLWAATGIPRLPVKRLEGALESAIDRSLVHWEFGQEETVERLQDYPWVAATYQALDWLGTDRDSEAQAKLDQIRQEVRSADRLMFSDPATLEAEQHGERYFRLRQEIESYHRSIEAQRREIESQRAEVDELRKAFGFVDERLQSMHGLLEEEPPPTSEQPANTAEQALVLLQGRDELEQQRTLEIQQVTQQWDAKLLRLEDLAQHWQRLSGSLELVAEGLAKKEAEAEALESRSAVSAEGVVESLSRIENLISGRLDRRHVNLLGKSLELSSRMETQWAETRSALAAEKEKRAELLVDRGRVEKDLAEAKAEGELALARQQTAEVRCEFLSREMAELEGRLEEEMVRSEAAERRSVRVEAEKERVLDDAQWRVDQAKVETQRLALQLDEARRSIAELEENVEQNRQELHQVLGRRSWKLTAPLRSFYRLFR